jgi:hypothetical protein
VLYVNPGSSGIVQLIGLGITGGYSRDDVHAHAQKFTPPDWRLTFCFLFAGWRCLCQGRHSDHLIVRHHWQHSYYCACSRSKFLIAPMGKLPTCLPPTHACTTANTSVNYSGCVLQRP